MTVRRLHIALGVALAVSTTGLVAAQNRADTPTNPFANDPAAAAAGKRTFDATCIVCHGENGAGTERAPSLRGRLKVGDEAFDVFETVQKGINGTAMPAFGALPANDIWRVVSYVQSLSGGGAAPAAAAAPAAGAARPAATPVAATGDAAAGQALFFGAGGCAACHEVQGRGGFLASDLSTVGGRTVAQIRTGVMHAPAAPGGGRDAAGPFQIVEITPKSGAKVTGVIKADDSQSIQLQRRDGGWSLFERSQVASITPVADGGLPQGVAAKLGAKGVDDVVAFLAAQKRRDWAQITKQPVEGGLPYERIARGQAGDPANWMTYWGDYNGSRFSELKEITTANVKNLQAKWVANVPYLRPVEATPLVVDGVMYTTGAPGDVFAFDARTGVQLWRFTRKQDVTNPYQINPSSRGVAVLGNRVFLNTLDNNLIALDARTGRPLWEKNMGDTLKGMTMTGAPLVIKDKLIIGMSGGELGVNGWLKAINPANGEELWHFDVIPRPGQPGNETWLGDSWKLGAGATWLTGSYDTETNTLIWPTGNPGPDFNHVIRKGDNLYSASVVGLDANTGKLKWHYQFTPNDSHDWDSTEAMVLADRMVNGQMRKVLLHADRNGFFYMIDRTDGRFIRGTAFTTQDWNLGFDANGRPNVRPDSVASLTGNRVSPSSGTNWQSPSYDKATGRFFFAYADAEGFANYGNQEFIEGQLYYARGNATRPGPSREPKQGIKALNADTGETLWAYPLTTRGLSEGVMGTRGGTLFVATAEGWLLGLDQRTGEQLWRFYTGPRITSSPISYAVDGKQYVAIAAGSMIFSFALP